MFELPDRRKLCCVFYLFETFWHYFNTFSLIRNSLVTRVSLLVLHSGENARFKFFENLLRVFYLIIYLTNFAQRI